MNTHNPTQPWSRPWEEIRKLVRPEVTSPEEFIQRLASGLLVAKEFLEQQGQTLALSSDKVRSVHRFAYRDVYAWAGDFRKPHQVRDFPYEVTFGLNDKYRGAPFGEIEPELASVVQQTKSILAQARAMSEKDHKYEKHAWIAQGIAYYHVCLEGVSPFLDGNGPVSRLLLDHHTLVTFGREVTPALNPQQYMISLDRAHSTADLALLRNQILEQCRYFDHVRATQIDRQSRESTDLLKAAHELGFDRSR